MSKQQGLKPNGDDHEGAADGDLQQTFDREYVVGLRNESAKYRKSMQDWKAKASEYEEQIKDSKETELAEQNKWRELAETRQKELESMSGYKDQYETVLDGISKSNERRIESIPQDMRTLVPDIEPTDLSQWLDANEALLKKPSAPDLGASAGNNDRPGSQVVLTEEELAIARKLGVSEEDYKNRK